MKISYIIDKLYSINAGTERQLYRLIQGMQKNGHDVNLYVLRGSDFTDSLETFPCDVINLNVHSLFSIDAWTKLWAFRKTLEHDGCDVLHGFFNDVALTLPIAFLFSNIKRYTSRRDMGIWYTPVRLFLLRLFSASRTHILCNSKAVAEYTSAKEWKSAGKMSVIYNGIDPLPSADDRDLPDWYPQSQLANEGLKVVLIANIRPLKHIQDLINASQLLVQQGLSIEYFIIGEVSDSAYYEYLQSLITEHELEAHFHFTGRVSEPRNYLHLFDIGISTSESEGFSNSIMDCLDGGLPFIASNVGGNPELITHGEDGFLYEVRDFKQLAEYIAQLVGDAELRTRLSSNAKSNMKRFNIPNMIRLHEEEYRRG